MHRGIYVHSRTGKLYNVIGVGRHVKKPNEQVVIYSQLYESKLNGTEEKLPYGSVWIRSIEDFNSIDDNGNKKFISTLNINDSFEHKSDNSTSNCVNEKSFESQDGTNQQKEYIKILQINMSSIGVTLAAICIYVMMKK